MKDVVQGIVYMVFHIYHSIECKRNVKSYAPIIVKSECNWDVSRV